MLKSQRLELMSSHEHEYRIIEKHIRDQAVPERKLKILEAGCGQRWKLNLDGIEYELTGVDLDADALKIRKDSIGDLDIAVEGDLRSVQFPEQQFDVIYSSFVLEHVENAGQVLINFNRWVKPSGLIVLRIPDPYSVQGFITRVTPHWFHVFYYRYLLGAKNAGKAGHGPYPVHYDPVVSRRGIREFCYRNGFTVLSEYGDGHIRPGKGFVRLLIHSVKQAVKLLSLGTLSARHSNLLFVLQKKPLAQPQPQEIARNLERSPA